jgi:hypothetical protein
MNQLSTGVDKWSGCQVLFEIRHASPQAVNEFPGSSVAS